jgi:hypothetical protein
MDALKQVGSAGQQCQQQGSTAGCVCEVGVGMWEKKEEKCFVGVQLDSCLV